MTLRPFNPVQTQPATNPIRILHPTDIQSALITPTRPVVLRNGENAKDSRLGAIVLLTSEHSPNTPPSIAPAIGPSVIAPTITGICTVVALMIGS